MPQIGLKLEVWTRAKKKPCKDCCCSSHCHVDTHGRNAKTFASVQRTAQDEFELFDRSWWSADVEKDLIADMDTASPSTDTLTSLIVRTHLDMDLEAEGGDATPEESHLSGHVKVMPEGACPDMVGPI